MRILLLVMIVAALVTMAGCVTTPVAVECRVEAPPAALLEVPAALPPVPVDLPRRKE